ncbi:MAG: hypothetical protein KatS3mg065_1148 [Chloroflexota bacterium]|nr:MAG: hypothetical protein KatS3mg065_1148 [Chloroflexota bacterium]
MKASEQIAARERIRQLRRIAWLDEAQEGWPYERLLAEGLACLTPGGQREYFRSLRRAVERMAADVLVGLLEQRRDLLDEPFDVGIARLRDRLGVPRATAAALASEARQEAHERRRARARALRSEGLTARQIGRRIAEEEGRKNLDGQVEPFPPDTVRRWWRP